MNKYSKNNKLNKVLMTIEEEVKALTLGEVVRYYVDFNRESDYNLAQYGNLRVYYSDVRELYKEYKTLESWSNSKIWELYKRQVGYVVRCLLREYKQI